LGTKRTQEESTGNNHGVYYDKMAVSLALFLERPDRACEQLAETRKRITQQIRPDV